MDARPYVRVRVPLFVLTGLFSNASHVFLAVSPYVTDRPYTVYRSVPRRLPVRFTVYVNRFHIYAYLCVSIFASLPNFYSGQTSGRVGG